MSGPFVKLLQVRVSQTNRPPPTNTSCITRIPPRRPFNSVSMCFDFYICISVFSSILVLYYRTWVFICILCLHFCWLVYTALWWPPPNSTNLLLVQEWSDILKGGSEFLFKFFFCVIIYTGWPRKKRSLAICALLEAPGWSRGLNISRTHFQTPFSWLNAVFWHGIVWQSSLWFLWAWELWHSSVVTKCGNTKTE